MKRYRNLFAFITVASITFAACQKSETPTPAPQGSQIISNDSSTVTGHLYVYTYDYSSGNKIGNASVFLFASYEDARRRLYLLYEPSSSSTAEADFGFLLQGNYYVVSNSGYKTDTSVVQVLGRHVIQKAVYLR